MKSCYYCGEQIEQGNEICGYDKFRARELCFCSQHCKELQKSTGWHYYRFPHTRQAHRLHAEDEDFEEFVKQWNATHHGEYA